MAIDANIYQGVDTQAPMRLAAILDPAAQEQRRMQSAQRQAEMQGIERKNKLQQLLGQGGDPEQLSQTLMQSGYLDEASKMQGMADSARQRKDAEMQRKIQLLSGAHARIGAKGGTPEAVAEEYAAIGLPPEVIQGKVEWVKQNLTPDNAQDYFLGVSDPAYFSKRQEAAQARKDRADEAAKNDERDRKNRESGRIPEGMRMGANGLEWIPGYLEGKTRIAQAGANAGGVPMTIIQTEQGPMQVPTRGGGGARPIVGPDGKPVAQAPKASNATEGERKAATLLSRLESSSRQLEQALKKDPNAAKQGLVAAAVGGLPLIGSVASNAMTPQARQRVEAAQLDMLDAALTLGTGAAYTKEQLLGYAKSYFPQIGDDKDTIKDKQDRLKNILTAARIAAGRAGPQVPESPPATPAAPSSGGALSTQERAELDALRKRFKKP
jgi:hypothetical protein